MMVGEIGKIAKITAAIAACLLAACDTPPGSGQDDQIVIASTATTTAAPEAAFRSWGTTTKAAADKVYFDVDRTFYCGCQFAENTEGKLRRTSNPDCGYAQSSSYINLVNTIEWEHIVPASHMPARNFPCWAGPGGNRKRCESKDPRAQAMIFDLHNLAPAIGQVNRLRLDDRYADLPDSTSDFGACQIEDTKDFFEPPDCAKGDAARVWLYMEAEHGVVIPADEKAMFLQWAKADPVSPWESKREERIAAITGTRNPFVAGMSPDAAGACWWEKG